MDRYLSHRQPLMAIATFFWCLAHHNRRYIHRNKPLGMPQRAEESCAYRRITGRAHVAGCHTMILFEMVRYQFQRELHHH